MRSKPSPRRTLHSASETIRPHQSRAGSFLGIERIRSWPVLEEARRRPHEPCPGNSGRCSERTRTLLEEDATSTDRIVVAAVVLLCCLFVAGLGLVVYYRNSPEHAAVLFGGGTFVSLLGIVAWLRKLWFDKRTMDLILVLVQSMSPADAAKVLTTFYCGALSPKQLPT